MNRVSIVNSRLIAILFVIVVASSIYYLLCPQDSPSAVSYQVPHPEESFTPLFPGWISYESPSQSFRVELPAIPQVIKEQMKLAKEVNGKIHYTIYFSGRDGEKQSVKTSFMISEIIYPDGYLGEPDLVLNQVLKDMQIANPQNSINSSKTTEFLGFPAIEFSFNHDASGREARTEGENKQPVIINSKSLAFVSDRSLYVLTGMDSSPVALEENFLHFRNSFVLLPRGTEEKTKEESRLEQIRLSH